MSSGRLTALVVCVIGASMLIGIGGSIACAALHVALPDWIGHSVDTALGALAGFLMHDKVFPPAGPGAVAG